MIIGMIALARLMGASEDIPCMSSLGGVVVAGTGRRRRRAGERGKVGKSAGVWGCVGDVKSDEWYRCIARGVGRARGVAVGTGWMRSDPVAVRVGVRVVLNSVFGIANRSLQILLDHEIPLEDRKTISAMALGHPDVRGLHDMKTRFGGNHYIVQFHLEMDPEITLRRTHEILDDVEAQVMQNYPGCEILIHADPEGLFEKRDGFD